MTSISKAESTSSDQSNETTVARFYDRWIGGFGPYGAVGRLIFGLSGDMYARSFIRAANVTPSDRILELGCGPGMILIKTHQLVSSRQKYFGFDISSEMIRLAKENINFAGLTSRIFPMIGGVNLPIASSSVDVVLLSHLVKYLTDDQLMTCFSECRRVLDPEGRLVLWEFSPTDVSLVTRVIAAGAGAVEIRSRDRMQLMLSSVGFKTFNYFDIVTPWAFWSNLAIIARP